MAILSDREHGDEDVKAENSCHVEITSTSDSDASESAWRCILQNPKIVFWTIYANVGSAMSGYENLALSVCLAMPAFQKTFASEHNGVLLIPAQWQSAWNAMFNVMNFVGSMVAGPIQDWFGRRAVFLACVISSACGIAVSYVSTTPAMYLGGKILVGFALGMMMVGTQTYVSETAPLPMRGIALSVNTVMLNLGMLLAISATYSRVSIMDESAFRVIFAAAWTFPAILAAGLLFLPESPYWLVMKNKHDKARRSLVRLCNSSQDIDARLADIQRTVELERQLNAKGVSLLECFKSTNWRRTYITLICFYMQHTVGSVLAANAPYFLSQTGLGSNTVVMLVQIGISMGLVSAIANIFLMSKFRHRSLAFLGVGICTLAYMVMGISSAFPRTNKSLLATGLALQFSSLSYGPAVGVAMAIAGEVSSTQLRAKTLSLGNGFAFIAGTIWMTILPYLFNTDQANLGGNIGWIFFGIAIIYLVTMYFLVPGTKGRSFKELDVMFSKRIPARKFESYDGKADTMVA